MKIQKVATFIAAFVVAASSVTFTSFAADSVAIDKNMLF